jgi:hypothetical protein
MFTNTLGANTAVDCLGNISKSMNTYNYMYMYKLYPAWYHSVGVPWVGHMV